jgi:hypothetical protein
MCCCGMHVPKHFHLLPRDIIAHVALARAKPKLDPFLSCLSLQVIVHKVHYHPDMESLKNKASVSRHANQIRPQIKR